MALKRSRTIRFGNVASNYVDEAAASSSVSSDSESESSLKVRKRFSTKRLMKDSECYQVDYDHIYSAVNGSEANKKRKMRQMTQENDDKPVKTRCFSKNAIMARLNRERKKVYVSTLENENESLREQNSEMNKKIEIQNKTISGMKHEIIYLKGLLANSKELGQILKNLQNTTSLPVSSSLISVSEDKDFVKPLKINNNERLEEAKHIKNSNSLVKFPMIYEDINLASTVNKMLNDNETADFENSLIKDENDLFLPEFNENFICGLEEPFSWKDSSFYSNACDPEFGVCLHVNQKRISIEVCSICNSKANLCLNEHHTSSKIFGT